MGKNFVEPATRAFSCLAKASVRVRRARQARRAERAGRRASSLLEDARRPVLSRRRKPTDAHGGFRGRAGRRKALMKQPFHLLKAPHAKISLFFQGYGLHWHLKTGDIPGRDIWRDTSREKLFVLDLLLPWPGTGGVVGVAARRLLPAGRHCLGVSLRDKHRARVAGLGAITAQKRKRKDPPFRWVLTGRTCRPSRRRQCRRLSHGGLYPWEPL